MGWLLGNWVPAATHPRLFVNTSSTDWRTYLGELPGSTCTCISSVGVVLFSEPRSEARLRNSIWLLVELLPPLPLPSWWVARASRFTDTEGKARGTSSAAMMPVTAIRRAPPRRPAEPSTEGPHVRSCSRVPANRISRNPTAALANQTGWAALDDVAEATART